MSCPDVGLLRAYVDRELPARRADEIARHVGGCQSCRERLAEIEKTAEFAGASLTRLGPSAGERPTEAALALAALRVRSAERASLGARLAGALGGLVALLSPARLGAAAVSLALVAVLFFTPVGLRAQGLLGVFRANDVVAVQVDPSSLITLPEPADLGTMNMATKPEVKVTTLADAGQQAKLTPRTLASVPSGFSKNPVVLVTSPVEGSYTYDLAKVQAYYKQRGLTSTPPAELGGLTINASVSPVVLQVYADQAAIDQIMSAAKAASDAQGAPVSKGTPEALQKVAAKSKVLVFGQVSSPKVEASSGVDIAALRQKILDSGAFPPELALQLAAIGDWQETLPVPVLKGTSRDVTVDGVHGILATDAETGESWLIWLKNGIAYGLGGNVSESALLDAAGSLSK